MQSRESWGWAPACLAPDPWKDRGPEALSRETARAGRAPGPGTRAEERLAEPTGHPAPARDLLV